LLLDIAASSITRIDLPRGRQSCAALSPDGEKVAYVRGHDLYAYDIGKEKEIRLTSDGSETVLNGTLSWLYWEEIFDRHDTGYWWSPDSKSIAFLRTDESDVSVQHYRRRDAVDAACPHAALPQGRREKPRRPRRHRGDRRGRTTWVDFTGLPYEYVVRLQWIPDGAGSPSRR